MSNRWLIRAGGLIVAAALSMPFSAIGAVAQSAPGTQPTASSTAMPAVAPTALPTVAMPLPNPSAATAPVITAPAAINASATPSSTMSPQTPITPTPVPSPTSAYEAVLAQRVGGVDGIGLVVAKISGDTTTISQAGALSGGERLSPDTLFEIGSVTKTFTATLLALMVQDGEVKLSDPVQKYVPSTVHVPTYAGKAITLLTLATQHSGLPRLPANMDPVKRDPYATYTTAKLYAFLNSYKLTRAPGATFEYSNLGIGLLGTALANRAHLSYEQLLQRRVLQPLGMTSTTTLRTPDVVAKMAIGHDPDGNPAQYWNFSAIAPAGAIVSSANDMAKYLACNLGRGPLGAACLFAQQPRDSFRGHKIGLVWWTDDGTNIIEHGGDTAAFHAGVAIAPDHGSAAVALTNGGLGAEDVALNAIDSAQPLAIPEKTVAIDASELAKYAGNYVGLGTLAGVKYLVVARNGGLAATLGAQPEAKLYATGTDTFSYHVVAANVKFVRDSGGAVAGVRLYQDGKVVAFAREGADPNLAALPAATPMPSPLALDASSVAEYAGTYHTATGADFIVTTKGAQLFVQLSTQPAFEVFASAKDRFFYKIVDAQIDFGRDANGAVATLTLHQNGRDLIANRAK